MKFNIILIVLLFVSPVSLLAQSSCAECHGEEDFIGETEDGKERSLFVDEGQYHESIHGDFDCTDCHVDAEVHTGSIFLFMGHFKTKLPRIPKNLYSFGGCFRGQKGVEHIDRFTQ